ncbi:MULTISPECIES: hypothetical protein [unclassified Paenibacillus]|uniref:hypothetical protein n=1 Tax=unclassified Paenibacillus TaxID=185978 RepID=UPI0009565BDF|nr:MULTISPECIES: hypothetical protein [unclassified Paenibacillus]ASS68378.1 hypothetical protein CIC07_21260 [Paenibacillus sp. RUD330]SIR31333.1 hypothetical protein SAMN05880555_3438 [Paenibacillus sp. RU4X]SIR42714.1 hypothetical protein SAMN05880570_3439 [Paenibacillus sp. RU4T]
MKKIKIIAVVAMSLALFTSVPFVNAESIKNITYATESTGGQVDLTKLPAAEKEKLEKRNDELTEFFLAQAKAQGKLTTAQKAGISADISSAKSEVKNIEDRAKEIGLEKVTEFNPVVAPMASSNSDFNWDVQMFYKDTSTGNYVWEAQGQFDSGKDWASECFCSPYYKWYNLGGDDGFGLASLHKDINIMTSGFWTLHDDLATDDDHSSNISTLNARGAGWAWQDRVYANAPLIAPKEYDSHRRLGWITFSFVGGTPLGQTISFQASTAHTWDSTSVNGISIGGGGVGFSWASQGSSWTKPTSKAFKV